MPGLLQDDHLLQNLAPLGILTKVLFVDAFNRDHVPGQVVQGKVNFSEGTLAKDLTNPVEVYSGHWHLTIVLEAQSDVLANLFLDLLLGSELRV